MAVFVDGCFWHSCPEHATRPVSNGTWWAEKLAKNVARDGQTDDHLRSLGWTVLRFWEHEDAQSCADRIGQVIAAQMTSRASTGSRTDPDHSSD
jgi:DNA mismatch endonuclease (patch repair protein)